MCQSAGEPRAMVSPWVPGSGCWSRPKIDRLLYHGVLACAGVTRSWAMVRRRPRPPPLTPPTHHCLVVQAQAVLRYPSISA